jgi:ubiquitin carboxyl-terminal hydrolase 1
MQSTLFTQPPPVLALHLNRSVHFGAYAAKNSARVHFPEVLDLTPFTTSGMLSTSPSFPMSSHMPSPTAAAAASLATLTTKAQNSALQHPRVLYRLAAVVCHYGQHSFGHYVCFRRKPRGFGRVAPPRLDEPPAAPGRGWLRASDDAVREVGIEKVLQEGSGAFMLYYERVSNEDRRSVWSQHGGMDEDVDLGGGAGGGEQKITQTHHLHLRDAQKWESREEEGKEKEKEKEVLVIKARVVRSVSLGRDDDDNGVEGVSVKQEMGEADPDSEARSLSSPTIAKPEPVEVELASTVSAEAPPPILDTPPAVDEPPITVPRTVVGLRA